MQNIQGFFNLDLLTVGVTIAAISILGFVLYFSNKKSITNRTFLLLALSAVLWSVSNYFSYQLVYSYTALVVLRSVLFFAVWFAFFLFQLLYVFPEQKFFLTKTYKYALVPIVCLVSILTITPYIISHVDQLTESGTISDFSKGPAIIFFGTTVISLLSVGIYSLVRKTLKAKEEEKRPFQIILAGTIITFSLMIIFNFIYPALLNNSRYVPLGALFIFPFIAFTFYAIYKHHLFNLRAAAVAGLTVVLTIASFIEIIFSNDLQTIIFRIAIFLLVLAVSIMMNRFVGTIAEQREALQVANKGQENLIHIMNHQIKGYLAKSRMIFSELLTDPMYGPVAEASKPMLDEGFRSLTEGVSFVEGVLNSSSASSGQLNYTMEKFDFKVLVNEVAEKQNPVAKARGIGFSVNVLAGDYNMTGDKRQLSQAVRNLVDNSIQYTDNGRVDMILSRLGNKIIFSVKDTGVGISPEDRPRLFTAGGRGKDSIKINVNSTGYGLSFVKGVAEAHHGNVGVDSAGPGKGSRFYMELPVTLQLS